MKDKTGRQRLHNFFSSLIFWKPSADPNPCSATIPVELPRRSEPARRQSSFKHRPELAQRSAFYPRDRPSSHFKDRLEHPISRFHQHASAFPPRNQHPRSFSKRELPTTKEEPETVDKAQDSPGFDSHIYSTSKDENFNKLLAIPNLLDSYVHIPLLPFLPYLDRKNDHLQYSEYLYKKPDDRWINLRVLRNWIETCDTYHANHCQTPSTIGTSVSSARPLWVIDVQRYCLIPVEPAHRYVTLSYVWGPSKGPSGDFSTTLANLSMLQKDQAFTKERLVLPRTIEHAIGLTRLLGETYLWVDRLCIVQDDNSTKSAQINSMAQIYANSYFTIVAAQGSDADAGLCGISTVTPPRSLLEREPLRYQDNYDALSTQAEELMDTNWYTRGWTFQEQLFSRRKIIFHNDTVNWECHCVAWYENQQLDNMVHQPCNRKPPSNQTGFDTTPWPDFYRYARLASLYNERSLTYPEDVLNAFAGVISVFGPAFDGGFICGLPQMFFDSSLLWQPYKFVRRRETLKSQSGEGLPSWSWIGWGGDLDSKSWRSGYDYLKGNPTEILEIDEEGHKIWEPTTWHTESKVQWFYSQKLESQKYCINISSQIYRRKDPDDSIDLPIGWSLVHSKFGKKYYRHVSVPNQEFWYPIPLPGSFTTEPPLFQPDFLHGRTRRGSLRIGVTFTNPEVSECLSCDLTDSDGIWAGALRLNLPSSSEISNEGSECSLIQLSFGSACNQKTEAVSFDEWYRPDCPRNTGIYEFYNVLWVEESNGVAYRKALGRVVKSVWERLSVEADITLG
ncbi:heterokaryon incompatibility protein-domain-containing protein [Tricladium varicosporioides]|nr:heterokaryon incompatibility protein-domain-containing protein [Hymenoscyphus varicosporioides]